MAYKKKFKKGEKITSLDELACQKEQQGNVLVINHKFICPIQPRKENENDNI